MQTDQKISTSSRIILVVAAICLGVSILFPLWKIDLFAPQYPEGLVLYIHADKLGGNVDIINGLNHYIGMQTLHAENFIEFSILKYILLFFSGLILVTALIGRKKWVYFTFTFFMLFALVSMADFYRWNYNYGHHLDPDAAIKVPGMTYQPPLIGFKQLLNFGAYSMPARGGLLFIGTGVLLLITVLLERKVFNRWFHKKPVTPASILLLFMITGMTSCSLPGPRPVHLNEEACTHCKMTITEAPFIAQLTTDKGRQYVFDDLICMRDYIKDNADMKVAAGYVADFSDPAVFVNLSEATLMQSDSLRSPMGGNVAGFAVRDSALSYETRYHAREVSWAEWMR